MGKTKQSITRLTTKSTTPSTDESAPSLFFGRDLSWLKFNRRVLEEAEDAANPLLERVKFLAITASNLDEFVEIRAAGILQRLEDGYNEIDSDGRTLQQTLDAIVEEMHSYVNEQYVCWNQQLLPELERAGVRVLGWEQMDDEAREAANTFYQREVDPLLTPITIDPAHPFPRVLNKALCIAFLLHSKRKATSDPVLGVITVPRALPRLVRLPSSGQTIDYIFLHDLIERNASGMYRGYEILSKAAFRVTRNSNLYFQEEESRNLLETVRSELHNRRKGDAVRLEIERSADHEIIERLRVNFELEESQVYRTDGPVNLSRVMQLYSDTPRPDLKFSAFVPRELRLHRKSADIFEELRHRDILLHHPYDSYDGVVGLIESAAQDPSVVSIKQTLYRTSSDSPIFRALTEAAATKEVTVVVELTARFDEASNIRWARALEDAGVQVFHGIVGLKTHCKLALLVRRDPDGEIRRYAHLGTGNYNPNTARFYTDLSLLTADPEITASVHNVFNYLTAHSEANDYSPLLVAPLTLAESFIQLIHREAEHARAGHPARIIAKMNSLLEGNVIEALYDASRAGVEIDLIVRGICSLRPGLPGVSEKIRVRSIVGRFLEHSRVYSFENGGQPEIYSGSADWMSRNLFERCETVFPIRDSALRARVHDEILTPGLADTVKARLLRADGEYIRIAEAPTAHNAPTFNSQDFLMRIAEGKGSVQEIPQAILYPLSDEQPPAGTARRTANSTTAKKATRRKKPSPANELQLAATEENPSESAL